MKRIKNRKSIIVFLSLLIVGLIFIGSGLYIKYEKNKTIEPEKNNSKEYKLLSLDDEIVQELFFMTRTRYSSGLFFDTDYYNIYYIDDELDLSKTSMAFKRLLAYYSLDENLINHDEEKTSFKGSDLKKAYIKIFGDDQNYLDGNINLGGPENIIYDAISQTYSMELLGYGYEKLEGYENKIIEARQYDETIEIYEKVIFYNIDPDTQMITYYKDSQLNEKIATFSEYETFEFDNHLNNLDTYKYIFKKNGGIYNFIKVERVK